MRMHHFFASIAQQNNTDYLQINSSRYKWLSVIVQLYRNQLMIIKLGTCSKYVNKINEILSKTVSCVIKTIKIVNKAGYVN